MLYGHNSNVTVAGLLFHVQTEDRGTANALIDTTVYCRGRVMHRLTNSYFDLLPLDADRGHALKLRLDEQHRTVVEELRSGVLQFAPPQIPAAPPARAAVAAPPPKPVPAAAPPAKAITLELLNARTWLAGRHATLQIAVRHSEGGAAVAGARITARIDGAAERAEFSAETHSNGQALLEFDMPRLAGEEPALVIEAIFGQARGHLRFQLRAKPRVPTAG
jgi:hypothetical protein